MRELRQLHRAHLHFQLQDHPSVLFAAGLPFRLARFEVDGTVARPRRELKDHR